jgi:hypothetical protein
VAHHELLHARLDPVPDPSHHRRRLPARVRERPVLPTQPRHHGTALAASHSDEELRLLCHRRDEELRRRRSQVESDLSHRREDFRVGTWAAGSVPADIARALAGSAIALKNAAAICDRPALCTQAKITVVMVPLQAPGQR